MSGVLVTGAGGRLGRALVARGAAGVTRAELDVTDARAVAAVLDVRKPDVVINAAAFTAVDRAERERDAAFAVNAGGAANLAAACAARGVGLVHVSTDHVFDGRAARPYREDDPTGPVNVYGASKRAGEEPVLAAGGTVVRTSWLFGGAGDPRGFVGAITRAARAGEALRVVDDQHGCPTDAGDLADVLLALAAAPGGPPGGVWHAAGDAPTTWYGFACAIVAALGLDPRALVTPIPSSAWPTAAARPRHAVLDTAKLRAWRAQFLSR